MFQRLNENKDLLIVAIASFFIGFGAASFFGGSSSLDLPLSTDSENVNETLPPLSFDEQNDENRKLSSDRVEMLRVENQRAGSFVQVQHTELADARWIVVREFNENQTPGNILGAGWQPEGVHNDIEVKLLRETTGGEQYQISLFADTDENKMFDHAIDMPLDIIATFTTIASPDEF